MPRFTITPEDFKRSKTVKPGWYPTLIKDVSEEMNSKKDAMNTVLDCENADRDSEYFGVPCKVWFSEKGTYFPGGAASFIRAFSPELDENEVQSGDYDQFKGRYILAKWTVWRGKDGSEPPQNRIEDWAPLGAKYKDLARAVVSADQSVAGFSKV